MEKYCYKVSVSSQCGKELTKFHRECISAECASEEYAKKMGAEAYHQSPEGFVGGIESLEFKDDKADNEVWKQIGSRNGRNIYLPNCEKEQGCAVFKKVFPKDTKTVIYQHKVYAWKDICMVYPLSKWADMVHIKYDDIKKEKETIEKKMSKYHFVQYTKFSGPQKPYRDSKMAKTLLRAIKAEYMRMKLPIISTEKLYDLLVANTKTNKKTEDTPTFFIYKNHYYISCNYPCANKDLKMISPQMYTLQRTNMSLEQKYIRENAN